MLTSEQTTTLIQLRLAARDVNERALLAYYTEKDFHLDDLSVQVERLQERIDAYRRTMPQVSPDKP